MGMSSEERSVWIQLGTMVVALGAYFALAARMLASGQRELGAFVALFLVAVVAMVILQIVSYVLAAIRRRADARDERDRLIAWKAEYRSAWLVTVGVLTAVTCLALGVHAVWVVNVLLLFLVLSEALGFSLQILYYRRGV